jgi:uncharacterized protein (TIGR03083 family)
MSADERDLMALAYEERCDLAAFLTSLTPREWQAQSLCDKWTVKDVVAHVVSYEELSSIGLAKRFAKGLVVRANEVGVREFAPMSPSELLNYLRGHLRPRGLTAAFGGIIGLIDGAVHHQDIRRALGYPRAVPVERLERILPLVPGNPRLGAGRRIKGLRLAATDVAWQHGGGPEVTGTGEALLMAMTGRPAALDELSGPGQPTLAARVTAQAHDKGPY